MQTSRLFEIIYILLHKKSVTARELAAQFDVSTRTIYRDVDILSLAGIPVYTERGKGGGISLLPNFVLSKSILSEREQHEILSALQGLSHLQVGDAGQVLQKLSAIFNKTAANWLEVDFTEWGFRDGHIFNGFKVAILEHKVAEFDYYSTYAEKTRRRVEPIQLWFKARAWYLKAFCYLRQDVRLFRLSRVRDLVITSEVFAERNLLAPPQNKPTHDPSQARKQKPNVTLRLEIAPEMTYRVFDEFDWDRAQRQPDGSYIVTETWPEDDWLYSKILSFGPYAEVLEPEHLKGIIKAKAKEISDKYL